MPQNPGLSPEVQEAMKRRQQGSGSPQLGQVSPQARMSGDMAQPSPMSELTKASAPPAKQPKFEPQDRKDIILQALIDQLDIENKSQEQQGMGGGGFSLSPGMEQPMSPAKMQGDYGVAKDYSGMNNYGKR